MAKALFKLKITMMNKIVINKIGIIIKADSKFLILKRNPKLYTGWGLITGKVEIDENLHMAAVRELKEETGLDISPEHDINTQIINTHIESGYFCKKNGCEVKINWFLIDLKTEPILKLEVAEWLDYKFVTLKEAEAILAWPTEIAILKKI